MMRSSLPARKGRAVLAVVLSFALAVAGLLARAPGAGSPVRGEETSCVLTMAVTGQGEVTPEVGDHSYACGEVVDVSATPAEGWRFDNWTGGVDDPASASTTITVTENRTVTAVFSLIEVEPETCTLTMAVAGEGEVTPEVGDHSCDCGEVVDVTASPAEGWRFENWTGGVDDPGSTSTTITVTENQTVTANFLELDRASPVLVCGWQQETGADPESGDPGHQVPGSQVLPPLAWGATRTVDCYLVVTDMNDGGDVDRIYAYVYYPAESPAPYRDASDPEGLEAGFKCQVVFTKVDSQVPAAALIEAAGAASMITAAPDGDLAALTGAGGAVARGTAALWRGRASIEFDEPAGDYAVRAWAVDRADNRSAGFESAFNYVPVSGVEVDFTGIEYGSVRLGIAGVQSGDRTWGGGLAGEGCANKATIRNIGNTRAHVTVEQHDMGFGTEGGASGTALVSRSPLGAASNWRVSFGVCLGEDSESRLYFDPGVLAVTPNYLELSAVLEIEFSILVKGGAGTHHGEMTIGSTIEPFPQP